MMKFTEAAQDAPVIHAGEEWAFLLRRMGGEVSPTIFHQYSFLDMSVKM
jgi:hypothetical protein